MNRRYRFAPASPLSQIASARGSRKVARAGDVVEVDDDYAAYVVAHCKGADGGPSLVPLDPPAPESGPEPPAPGADVEAPSSLAPAGDEGPAPEAPPEAPLAPAPEAWADAWPEPPSAVLDDAGALPGAVEAPADDPPAAVAEPAEGPGATGGDAPPAPLPAPEVDPASVMARVEALHHNRRLAVARRLPGGGSARTLVAALAVIERALATDPAAVEAAVSEVEASVAAGDRS